MKAVLAGLGAFLSICGATRQCRTLRDVVPGKLWNLAIVGALLALAPCAATGARVDPFKFAACKTGSIEDLKQSIEAHNEHVFRLQVKFRDVWYLQGRVPDEVRRAVTLDGIVEFLTALRPRKAAVLFHAAGADRFCTWLVASAGPVIRDMRIVGPTVGDLLQPTSWHTLGVRGLERPRTTQPVGGARGELATPDEWEKLLDPVKRLLLPERIERALIAQQIDTLIVVPVSIRRIDPNIEVDRENLSATHLDKRGSVRRLPPESRVALSVGVVPFAALRVGGTPLLERMSVVIAPGFFSFARNPMQARQRFSQPVVVGDPEDSGFAPLPGAREEAVEVAARLNVTPFVGKRATKAALESYLRQHSRTIEFIHLATHGVADSDNPVDESFLVFSDGPWNARQISGLREKGPKKKDLPLLKRQPLVVMSACQTALGKDFPAGTIGLARAWQWAGASNVVMSLWSVDDAATRELMTSFIASLLAGTPVDKALQSAMLAVRERYPSPAHWASFGVFGTPERLH